LSFSVFDPFKSLSRHFTPAGPQLTTELLLTPLQRGRLVRLMKWVGDRWKTNPPTGSAWRWCWSSSPESPWPCTRSV